MDAIDNKAAARIHHRRCRNSRSRACAHAETNLQDKQTFISLGAALHDKPNACSSNRQGRAGNSHRHQDC
jgi:hypothetical protein